MHLYFQKVKKYSIFNVRGNIVDNISKYEMVRIIETVLSESQLYYFIVNDVDAAGVCSKRISAEDDGKILSRIIGLQ
jgi:hypothetical protein